MSSQPVSRRFPSPSPSPSPSLLPLANRTASSKRLHVPKADNVAAAQVRSEHLPLFSITSIRHCIGVIVTKLLFFLSATLLSKHFQCDSACRGCLLALLHPLVAEFLLPSECSRAVRSVRTIRTVLFVLWVSQSTNCNPLPSCSYCR